MEYAIIGIVIVVVIVIGTVLFLKQNKNTDIEISLDAEKVERKTESQMMLMDNDLQDLQIQIEMLPAESVPDKNKLVEITDSKVLARVNNLIPELVQVGNAANNAAQAVRASGEVFYRAIIPSDAKLTASKTMEGAVRGFYHNSNGIRGHANFVAYESQEGTKVVTNTMASAMGVASMVVGQYYMNQINAELEEINDGISRISDFQESEYRSRVFSLVAHVKKISDFQIEILENNELRLSKISQLDSLEEECTQLLGQANLSLARYTKMTDIDYVSYEKELPNIQNWYIYQYSLLDILHKISNLRYTLYLGTVSREQCAVLLPTYKNQVAETQRKLTGWHETTVQRLKIDISEVRRKRDGLDRAIYFIPGFIKDDLNYKPIERSTANMIKAQSEGSVCTYKYDTSDLYGEDVQLISKDGKLYYLPVDNLDEKPIL